MARRNATRRSSCCEIDSATSCASSSGLRISTILMTTSLSVSLATDLRSFSMSAPFLPITTPGRAEWMVTRHFLCGRSITIFDTAACFRLSISSLRMRRSSCSNTPYSILPANQRESHVRLMPRRSPIGLTFWPIGSSLSFRLGLDLPHHDGEVGKGLQDLSHAAAAARREALEHQRLADMRLGDDEIVDVEIVIVLGIGDRRFQALAHVARDPLARELEIG